VQISDYDPTWPQRFNEQRDRLTISLRPWLLRQVEHVGSTAVPGLRAKPIIDIAAPVKPLTEALIAIEILEQDEWLH
jgi:GrpB-like predicted nucleotidyltransferase (UPF0157 family)